MGFETNSESFYVFVICTTRGIETFEIETRDFSSFFFFLDELCRTLSLARRDHVVNTLEVDTHLSIDIFDNTDFVGRRDRTEKLQGKILE